VRRRTPKPKSGPRYQSKLLQRRAAAAGGVTLDRIYDVYIKPDGRVEGEGGDVAEALDRADDGARVHSG
jgi:hypothetical protein